MRSAWIEIIPLETIVEEIWSRSMRSAWIEIELRRAADHGSVVALHAERVDRNYAREATLSTSRTSRSMRSAWIEISAGICISASICGRAPCGARG